jgi:hypothetical protein
MLASSAIVLVLLIFLPNLAAARPPETVCVKFGQCPLSLATFACTDTPKSSFVRRVCHDDAKSFMVINLSGRWYPYCGIGADVVQELLTAESVGRYYNKNIRSRRNGTHGPFDCRDHPMPNY